MTRRNAGDAARAGVAAGLAAKRPVSWSEIERVVLLRVARSEYTPGQRIPTCEALASELGANKNTVSKAYRSLAQRGYLVTRAGLGTFIARRPSKVSLDTALDGINGLLVLAAQEAKLAGLGEAQFREFVDGVVAQAYAQARPRVGFIECNRRDATTLSRDLQLAVAHPIEPLLIDAVLREPRRFLDDYTILAVNLSHLSAVESALGRQTGNGGRARIFGMHIPIDPESLVQVARLRAGTRVGIVCDLQPTLLALTGMVDGYNPGLRVQGCIAKDRTGIANLLRSCDVLLVTPSAAERLSLGRSQVPVITLAFRPDARSVEQLAALIAASRPKAATHRFRSNGQHAPRHR
ncbi:MAG TPA: GntR family transcriptional regulator [Casimicrobiaceae bacterium]|nr:GntR family transcriptional regulator [Casimicrobiaceae bacterium]